MPWTHAALWSATATLAFHTAWLLPSLAGLSVLFLFGLLQLTRLAEGRGAFYIGLAIGLACYAPHLGFFWTIFGPAAVVLWCILGAWLGLFVVLGRFLRRAFAPGLAAFAFALLWTALEYFRSELYYLRFSWLSVGYAFSELPGVYPWLGVYGVGLVSAAVAAVLWLARGWVRIALLTAAVVLPLCATGWPPHRNPQDSNRAVTVPVAGLQLEYPGEDQLLGALEDVAARHPEAAVVVLSEYSLQGRPPAALLAWCQRHRRYLIVGGKDPLSDRLDDPRFYNTAFVIGPTGAIVHRQAKSVPIQFFDDGERATQQQAWASPWGSVGLAICYDLSYRRVMDPLARQGVQALVVPTADDSSWGGYQHRLHTRIARVRAAEYGIPILRVAGSGISQCVGPDGRDRATAPFPGPRAVVTGTLVLDAPARLPWDLWLAPAACVGALGFVTAAFARRHNVPS